MAIDRHSVFALYVALLVLSAWGGVLGGSFQYDDYPNLLNDPAMGGGDLLTARLREGVRPLTRLSHVMDAWMWGDWAGGWLLGNLLLHLATVSGVLMLARARAISPAAAWTAAALFALQPSHGMTVAYVSGRAAGLMTALLVLALLAHERGLGTGRGAGRWRGLSLLAFGLACLAKETALCYPLLVLLWEAGRSETRQDLPGMLRRVAPVAALTLVLVLLVLNNQRYTQLLRYSLDLRAPLESLWHNAIALPATLSLLMRPWDLGVVHSAPQSPLWLLAWLPVAWALWKRRPWMLFALLWPVVALLPSHSLVAKSDAVSESGLYLCWLGPSLVVAQCRWVGDARRWRVVWVAALLAALVPGCLWRTQVWGDPVRLWREATVRDPDSARVWNNLGMAYLADDQLPRARAALDHALRLDPDNPRTLRNRQILELVN